MKDLKRERIEKQRFADTCKPDKLRQKEAVDQETVKHFKEQTEQKRRQEVRKPPDGKPPDSKPSDIRPPNITPITMTCDADGIWSSVQTFISFVVAVVCFCIYCFCFCYNAFDDKF